jgi:hypothetical protein
MEQRGLVSRAAVDGAVGVSITAAGQNAVPRARPLHAAAVRRHLIDLVPDGSEKRGREKRGREGVPAHADPAR